MRKIVLFLFLFLSAGWLSATTYYVDPQNTLGTSADANNGTSKATAWLHAPGMTGCSGVCNSTVLNAGDSVIVRGGTTIPHSYLPWTLKARNGTAGNVIYYGVDVTWFSGGSFTRPVINGGNPTSTSFVASCTGGANSGTQVQMASTLAFITFDDFEFKGFCWTGNVSSNGAMLNIDGGATNIIISNNYFHGWTMTSGASDNFPSITGFGGGTTADGNQFTSNVFDGSDSPHFPAGDTTNCQWSGNNAVSCYSGQGMNGSHFYNVDHNVFRYLSNAVVTANCHSYHDNLFEFIGHTFASGSLQQHPNVMNCLGGATGENLYWYNNLMRHTFMEENIFFAVRTNVYVFNNVSYDNMNSDFGPLPSACVRYNTVANSSLPVNAFIYNNTDGDNTCQLKFEVANAPLTKWSGTGTFENNHYGAQGSNCTGTCGTALTGEYTCPTSGTCTVVNNGTHVFQTTATETAQGYTAANLYQPTTGGTTIGAGANSSASCSTFSPGSDLCSGSSAGVAEVSGSGGKIASSPNVPIISRASTWDSGAFQFSGAAISPTCTPGSTTSSSAVTETCNNPNGGGVMCASTTALPVTNGAGTACNVGTLVTSTFNVSSTATMQIVAGTSLLSDSPATSYSITITTQAKKWIFTPPTTSSTPLTNAYAVAAGGVITIPWSADTAPSKGGWEASTNSGCGYTGLCPVAYSFTNFDAVITQQLGFGAKKVRVVLAAGQFGGSNTFTPNYIFDAAYATHNSFTQQFTCADSDYAGSGAITPGNCAQGVDNTAAPIYWLTTEPFRPRWIAAVVAAVNHMAACTVGTCGYDATQIDSVRPGGGLGGEWFPWGTSAMVFQVYGAVNSTTLATFETDWIAYVNAMETTVNAAGSGFLFIQSMNGGVNGGNVKGNTPLPYFWSDDEASTAHTNGWGHGDQGLTGNWTGATGSNSDIQRFANNGYASGTTHTFTFPSFDSAFVFNTYPADAPLEVQTGGGGASDPTGATSPGSLVLIIPYAINTLKATDIEVYWQDWQVAYDPGNANYATYHVTYQQLLSGSGSGSFPAGISGAAVLSGKGIVQ